MAHFPSIPTPKKPGKFVPKRKIKRSGLLRPADVRHVLRVINVTSRWPQRDSALILTSLCTGMRCSEMARITPRDVLLQTGAIRNDVKLRPEITKGCKARMAYFSNTKLVAALDTYIQDRLVRKIGLGIEGEYRGLNPDTPLYYSSRHGGFSMIAKPRVLESGEIGEYAAADGLEHLFRRIYDRSGLKNCASHSGRRTFSSTLLAKGVSSEDISKLLGHAEIDVSGAYLECSDQMIEEAYRDIF